MYQHGLFERRKTYYEIGTALGGMACTFTALGLAIAGELELMPAPLFGMLVTVCLRCRSEARYKVSYENLAALEAGADLTELTIMTHEGINGSNR